MNGNADRARLLADWTASDLTGDFDVAWDYLENALHFVRITWGHEELLTYLLTEGLTLGDLAALTPQGWYDILESVTPPVPTSWQGTRRHYARRLTRRVTTTFGSLVFWKKAQADASAGALPTEVVTFLGELATARKPLWHEDLLAEDYDWRGLSDAHQRVVRGVQRLARLAPSVLRYELVQVVRFVGHGADGARGIVAVGRKRFAATVAARLRTVLTAQGWFNNTDDPVDVPEPQQQAVADALAESLYQSAERVFSAATAMEFQARDADLALGVPWISPASAELSGAITSRCACDPCTASTSPGAYLFELLDFVAKVGPAEEDDGNTLLSRLQVRLSVTETTPLASDDDVLTDAMLERRPDILLLQADCATTQTMLPQIDLVNELLERRVVIEGIALGALGEGVTAADLPTTTVGTEAERRLSPQSIANREHANTLLGSARFPPPLPWDPAADEVRALLEPEGVDRARLMWDLRRRASGSQPSGSPASAGAAARMAEVFRWTLTEATDLQAEPAEADLFAWFGLEAGGHEQLARVDVLLHKTGWTFEDLRAILATRVVNPTCQYTLVFEGDACDLAAVRISRATSLGVFFDFTASPPVLGAGAVFDPDEGVFGDEDGIEVTAGTGTEAIRVGLNAAGDLVVGRSGAVPTGLVYDLATVSVDWEASPRTWTTEDAPDTAFVFRLLRLWRFQRALGVPWQEADRIIRAICAPEEIAGAWSSDTFARWDAIRRLKDELAVGWNTISDLLDGPDTFGRLQFAANGGIHFVGGSYDGRFQSAEVMLPVPAGLGLAANRTALGGGGTIPSVLGALLAGARLDITAFERLRATTDGHPFELTDELSLDFVKRAYWVRAWADALGVTVTKLVDVGGWAITGPLRSGDAGLDPALTLEWVRKVRMLAAPGISSAAWPYLLSDNAEDAALSGPSATVVDKIASDVRQLAITRLAALQAEMRALPADPFAWVTTASPDEATLGRQVNAVLAGRDGAPEVAVSHPDTDAPVLVTRRVWQALDPASSLSSPSADLEWATGQMLSRASADGGASWLELRNASGGVESSVSAWVAHVLAPTSQTDRAARFSLLAQQWWWRQSLRQVRRWVTGGLPREMLPEARRVVTALAERAGRASINPGPLLVAALRPALPELPTEIASNATLVAERAAVAAEYDALTTRVNNWVAAMEDAGATPPVVFAGSDDTPVVLGWEALAAGMNSTDLDADTRRSRLAFVLAQWDAEPAIADAFGLLLPDASLRLPLLTQWLAPGLGAEADRRLVHDFLAPGFRTGTSTPAWLRARAEQLHKVQLATTAWPGLSAILAWRQRHGDLDTDAANDLVVGHRLPASVDTAVPSAIGVDAWFRTWRLLQLEDRLARSSDDPAQDVLPLVEAVLDAPETVVGALAVRLDRDEAETDVVVGASGMAVSDIADPNLDHALDAFESLAALDTTSRSLRVPLDVLLPLRAPTLTDDEVVNVRAAIRQARGDGGWTAAGTIAEDRNRARRRDALVGWLIHHSATPMTLSGLQADLLTDPMVEPVVQTSRLVWCTEAVQALIFRSTLGLEPGFGAGAAPLSPVGDEIAEWGWMKRYRLWEANRRIFLFPENWTEPDLLVDKSEPFEEFEKTLRKAGLTDAIAEQALGRYLFRLREIGRLAIVSHYVEAIEGAAGFGRLHLLGKTRDAAPRYFYRSQGPSGTWTPWQALSLDISGGMVAVYGRAGFRAVLWVELTERQREAPTEAESSEATKVTMIDSLVAIYRSNYEALARAGLPLPELVPDGDPDAYGYKQKLLEENESIPVYQSVPCKATLRVAVNSGPGWVVLPARLDIANLVASKLGESLQAEDFWLSADGQTTAPHLLSVRLMRRGEAADGTESINTKRAVVVDLATNAIANDFTYRLPLVRADIGSIFPPNMKLSNQGFVFPEIPGSIETSAAQVDVPMPTGFGEMEPVFLLSPSPRVEYSHPCTTSIIVLPEHAGMGSYWGNVSVVVDDQRSWMGVSNGWDTLVMEQVEPAPSIEDTPTQTPPMPNLTEDFPAADDSEDFVMRMFGDVGAAPGQFKNLDRYNPGY